MAALHPVGTTPYGRLVGMSAAFATSNLSRTAISFATSLVIARALGVEDFGRWTLCTAWAAVLTTVVDFGFGVLLTRDAARDDPATGQAVAVAFVVRLGVLLPLALLFVVAPSFLSPDAATAAGLRIAPLIAIGGVAYGCLASVFRAWPRSLVMTLGIETSCSPRPCRRCNSWRQWGSGCGSPACGCGCNGHRRSRSFERCAMRGRSRRQV